LPRKAQPAVGWRLSIYTRGEEQMIRKLKILGLVLTAILAMSAVVASASQATAGSFTWANGTVKLDMTQDTASPSQRFVIDAGATECNEVHGSAVVTGTSSTDVHATSITYQNSGSADTCPSSIGTATFNMNGCGYTFTAGTTLNAMETTAGELHIVCPAGQQITKTKAGLCTVEIPGQTIKGGHTVYRTITNVGGAGIHAVTAEFTVSGITYDQTGIFCPNGGTKHASNGTYTGKVTITGTNASGNQTSVEVS
jgi:hypothetical protein